jgi:arginyl-tRNA synthetase
MKEIIVDLLKKELPNLEKSQIQDLIEIPPQDSLGDYSFPCFSLAKIQKKSPLLIAEELKQKLIKIIPKQLSSISTQTGYVNFFLNKNLLAEKTISEILKQKQKYGKNNQGKNKTIVIDLSAPNIAKPFGKGHLRSTIMGNSISNIAQYNGYKTIKINYLGDWGTQFGKLILGYKEFGSEKELKKDPFKHLLEIYVKINSNEDYEEKARYEFKKLEQGDKENLKLWKKFKEISIKKFNEIYKTLGIKFDIISGESHYNNKMQEIIEELKNKNLLEKSQGALIVNLEKYNLNPGLIQKNDGTSLYLTRDLAAAIDRQKTYKAERLIYEVGNEQTNHFNQLFKILELMGYEWAKDCKHVSHGLYLDKDGKKFATRKGKTILMSEIIQETINKAKENLEKRFKLDKKELEKRSLNIALSAIFYGDLKNHRENNIVFDIDRFLSFEGDTGPYLLYTYARANSIIKKVKSKQKNKNIIDLKEQEISLIKSLNNFPERIKKSYENLAPNIIANYTYNLAKEFNEFYHSCPVLENEQQEFRLKLTKAFKIVMKSCLNILGIKELEEM